MNQYADIVVFDKNGQLALIAQVKSKRGTSRDWAAKMRGNMYAHGLLPHAPFFLLALPDRFYLWKNTGKTLESVPPTHEIDPMVFLKPYYDSSGILPTSITGKSFELIIVSWLNQILMAENQQSLQNTDQDWLVSSGLFSRLTGGHLELETAA